MLYGSISDVMSDSGKNVMVGGDGIKSNRRRMYDNGTFSSNCSIDPIGMYS